MWIGFAAGSAFFAGVTSILAKCGIRKTNSNVATAVRTIVVLIFSWVMVFLAGSWRDITQISVKTLTFLILSGLSTGASWLCYFKALQIGDINKVVPIDKSSTVMTIILSMIFFGEKISIWKMIGIAGITIGTFLMMERKQVSETDIEQKRGWAWLAYVFLSAIFASLTAILGKIGISDVESNLGTAIRTGVVLVMAWVVVFVTGKKKEIRQIPKKEMLFIIFSGVATGASWLCYYRALQDGPASIVVAVDKLSIVVTILFSYIVFRERLSVKLAAGLLFIVTGTMLMLV